MLQFTIPQFIDVEDKIIGPITTRQFIIMLVGFMIIGISYKIFDFSLFVTVSIIIFGVSSAFAFARINGRPFHLFVLNIFQTLKKPKIRVWNHMIGSADDIQRKDEADDQNVHKEIVFVPKKMNVSRLAELSLIVDTGGSFMGKEE